MHKLLQWCIHRHILILNILSDCVTAVHTKLINNMGNKLTYWRVIDGISEAVIGYHAAYCILYNGWW